MFQGVKRGNIGQKWVGNNTLDLFKANKKDLRVISNDNDPQLTFAC